MTLQQRLERERGGILALVVLVISAYVVVLLQGSYSPTQLTLLLTLGSTYLGLSILASLYLNLQRAPLWLSLSYFALMLVLVTGINYMAMRNQSFAMSWLVVLPLISQSMEIYPRPLLWNGIISILALATCILPMTLFFGLETALQTAIFIIPAILFVAVFTRVAQREREARERVEHLAQALNEVNQKLRLYAAQAEELATTKERNRLARDIHDSLGHYLTVINVQLEAAQTILDQDRDRGLAALQKAQRLAQEGLREVRQSVKTLRESPFEGRLLPELLSPLLEACQAAGLTALLQVDGEPYPLAEPVQMALYRAAQEGLTNVRKHAQAQRVEVTLSYEPDQVALTITDDGQGAAAANVGFGLIGIEERVALLGGRVQIKTAPGDGFHLHVTIPKLSIPTPHSLSL